MTSSETKDPIWEPEQYHAYHKLVFRVVFDFLNTHFPPGNGPDYWEKFAEDIGKASDQFKGGKLGNGMLVAVSDYLEEEYKKRRDADG